jgi:hypothetical protein
MFNHGILWRGKRYLDRRDLRDGKLCHEDDEAEEYKDEEMGGGQHRSKPCCSNTR